MPDFDKYPANPAFCTTHWSAVVEAGKLGSPRADEALAELCRSYWYPLYAFIRRRGYSPTETEDLTQAFFERLLAKNYIADVSPEGGRFRAFLLTSVKNFLANEWDRAQTAKRGGGKRVLSLDEQDPEGRYQFEPVDRVTPEVLFEQRWALAVLEQVLARLRAEFAASNKLGLFDELKAFLSGQPAGISYAEAGDRLGMRESAVKVAIHRLRRRYGELLQAEIGKTVNDPAEVEAELRHLLSVISGAP